MGQKDNEPGKNQASSWHCCYMFCKWFQARNQDFMWGGAN